MGLERRGRLWNMAFWDESFLDVFGWQSCEKKYLWKVAKQFYRNSRILRHGLREECVYGRICPFRSVSEIPNWGTTYKEPYFSSSAHWSLVVARSSDLRHCPRNGSIKIWQHSFAFTFRKKKLILEKNILQPRILICGICNKFKQRYSGILLVDDTVTVKATTFI